MITKPKQLITSLLILSLFIQPFSVPAKSSPKEKNSVKIPHLLLALRTKLRHADRDGSTELTEILIKKDKIVYGYRYTGFHPDPYFRRKIQREMILNGKEVLNLINYITELGLLKNVVDIKPHLMTKNSFNIDLTIQLRKKQFRAKLNGLTENSHSEKNISDENNEFYQNIIKFTEQIRKMATAPAPMD